MDWERVKNFCNANLKYLFLVALMAVVALAVAFAGHPSQNHQQSQQHTQAQQQQQPQAQQQQQTAQNLTSYQGAPVMVTGLASASLVDNVEDCSGQTVSGIEITTNFSDATVNGVSNSISPGNSASSLILLLPSGVKGASFDLAQQVMGGDINTFAYETKISVLAGGKQINQVNISKDSLLTTDVPVDIKGGRQVEVKFCTVGDAHNNDQYGPFFPVILANLNMER